MTMLLLEKTEEGYEFVSLAGGFADAARALHAHFVVRGDQFPDGSEVQLSNSFLTFRPVPVPEGHIEVNNAKEAYEAYLVQSWSGGQVFDTGCLLLDLG
jgi:hypothetical protein